MSIKELRNNFESIYCCKCNENYKYKWINLGTTNKIEAIIKFSISQSTHMFISVHQQDNRLSNSVIQ